MKVYNNFLFIIYTTLQNKENHDLFTTSMNFVTFSTNFTNFVTLLTTPMPSLTLLIHCKNFVTLTNCTSFVTLLRTSVHSLMVLIPYTNFVTLLTNCTSFVTLLTISRHFLMLLIPYTNFVTLLTTSVNFVTFLKVKIIAKNYSVGHVRPMPFFRHSCPTKFRKITTGHVQPKHNSTGHSDQRD